MAGKIYFILILFAIIVSSCGYPSYKGHCGCENPEADYVYKINRIGYKKQVRRASEMCQDRAKAYGTTCALEIPK